MLYPYQKAGVEFLKKNKYALLADDMGLGKTAQAIVAARGISAKDILVLCPASVKYVWKKEIEKWDPGKSAVAIYGRTVDIPDANYTIVNYDITYSPAMFKQLALKKYDLLICDEAHYLKNSSSKRTKAVYLKKGLKDRSSRVWLLTGTPVLNRPVELYTHLSALTPEVLGGYSSYIKFCERYCDGSYRVIVPERRQNGIIVRPEKKIWDTSGASNIEELSQKLSGFMLRRLKTDVLAELPEKTYQNIYIDADEEKTQKERELYGETRNDILGELALLRHEAGMAKVPLVVSHIKDILEDKPNVVVFAYHRAVIGALEKGLREFNPVTISGATPTAKREAAVRTFIEKEDCRVFIGQIQAAGTGIDGLQNVCDTVVFAEMSWVPGEINQAVDRCHRIGQNNPVLVQFVLAENGVDEMIAKAVASKRHVINKLIRRSVPTILDSLARIRKTLEGYVDKS